MSVISFGSINMDLVVRTPRFANPGETIVGLDFYTAPGGKGANQAIALAKLGESVMIFLERIFLKICRKIMLTLKR